MTNKNKIPKIIHYCWFGPNKMKDPEQNCINSWREFLPDYKVIKWDENNVDLTHPFLKYAYENKKWAFVADFIRLQKIYEIGGIYLDTDMLVLKSFNPLLKENCFFGAENLNYVSCGIIGAVQGNMFLKNCLEIYDSIDLNKEVVWNHIAIPRLITTKFRLFYNYTLPFEQKITINDITIYPSEYFYPLPDSERMVKKIPEKYISKTSYTIHLWSGSWRDFSEFYYLRNRFYIKGFSKVLKHLKEEKKLKFSYLRKIASCIKQSLKPNPEGVKKR